MSGAASVAALVALFFLAPPAYAQDDCGYITKQDYPMAAKKEDLDLFSRSLTGGDTALFLKLRQEGRARLSVAGLDACILERKDANKIKIRLSRGATDVWTLADAVKRKGAE